MFQIQAKLKELTSSGLENQTSDSFANTCDCSKYSVFFSSLDRLRDNTGNPVVESVVEFLCFVSGSISLTGGR
jgi:hypothetical protein